MKNRTVIGIICVIAAFVISFGIAPLTNRILDNKTEVVRVRSNVKAGQLISENEVELVTVGAFNVPEGALSNMLMVLGRYATTDMYAGDYVFAEKLSYSGMTAAEILGRQEEGKVAVSVTVRSFASGLSGKIENGDIVKIMVYKEGKVITPNELKYMMVVTATDQNGFDRDEMTETRKFETITLMASEMQAEKLVYYENTGNIHFMLVHKGDDVIAQELLAEQERILGQMRDEAEMQERLHYENGTELEMYDDIYYDTEGAVYE